MYSISLEHIHTETIKIYLVRYKKSTSKQDSHATKLLSTYYFLITYPNGNVLVGFHLAITDAIRPITRAEQSNSIWKPSEINPKLLVQTPYVNSTKVKPGKK